MRVPEPKVFISYRREETDGYAGRLYDAMVARFGEANVFTGIDLEPGIDFVQRINVAVGFCDVVLVIVGPEWASVIDDDGARRLANPDDFVRLEVEAALRQDVEVIPVLIAGAEVPDPDDLPEALRPITGRTAAELSDVRWGYDVDRLLSMLDQRAAGLLFEAGAATRRIEPDTVEARFRRLLVEGAHHGVLPEPALELATYLRPEWEVTWAPAPAPAPSPESASPPTERAPPAARSLLLRAALILIPLAALAAALKWLVGCTVDYPVPEEDEPAAETVDCSVFAPTAVAVGEAFLVQVFAHPPLQYADARALATEFDPGATRRGFRSLESRVAHGTALSFQLAIPGAEVDEPVQSLVWRGRAEAVQFGVTIGAGRPQRSLIGTVDVSQESIPIGHLKFRLEVKPDVASRDKELQPAGDDARRYRTAFTSYASEDRDHVLRGVQMLRVAGIRCFQDVVDLEPGDRWERKLYSNIDNSDLFLLFWSSAAKDSRWVRKEANYALRCKQDEFGPPEIKPIILERPPSPPWPELAHLHFNDPVVYFVRAGD